MAKNSIGVGPTLLIGCMTAAVIGLAATVYLLSDPLERLTLSLALLAPIIWAAAKLGVVEKLAQFVNRRPYQRRFLRLRTQVDRLLGEIRRLNGLAADRHRGSRDDQATLREMAAIEGQLTEIVKQICAVAGKETEGYVDRPTEVEQAIFR